MNERPQAQSESNGPVNRSNKGLGRPVSISARSSAAREPSKGVKKTTDPSKTAMQMIRVSGGVGTDLVRASSKRPPPPTGSLGTAFLKPSGVDEPVASAQGSVVTGRNNNADSEGRRQATGAAKRERETGSEPIEKERKKRKKKQVVVRE